MPPFIPGKPHMVFELTPGGIEGVPNCDVNVFVGLVLRRRAAYDKLSPGNDKIDAYMPELSLTGTARAGFDHHPTDDDSGVELLKLGGSPANGSRD